MIDFNYCSRLEYDVILVSYSVFFDNSQADIAKEFKNLKLKTRVHIIMPKNIYGIEFENEELKEIMQSVYETQIHGLRGNYDEVRKKTAPSKDIYTLGYGFAELDTLDSGSPVKVKLDLKNGKPADKTELTDGKKLCDDARGFVKECYDKDGKLYKIDEAAKYTTYLVYKHENYAVKFFNCALDEGFKKKINLLEKLKKENSPFARALPLSLLYASQTLEDNFICGYMMQKFDRPGFCNIGEFTVSKFKTNAGDKFKNDETARIKILASLAECFVFYHARDILLSDIKPDNFFVDNADLSVFPIDSDGFSCCGGSSQPPRPEYSETKTTAYKAGGYRQSMQAEYYAMTALIFEMATSITPKDCKYDLEADITKYADILNGKRKAATMEERFYKIWFSYPDYIRNKFIEAKNGNYSDAYGWKLVFNDYIEELSRPKSTSENVIIEEMKSQNEKLNKELSVAKSLLKSFEDKWKTSEKSLKEKNEQNIELQRKIKNSNNAVAVLTIFSILMIAAIICIYAYFTAGKTSGSSVYFNKPNETNIFVLHEKVQQNQIQISGGKFYEHRYY